MPEIIDLDELVPEDITFKYRGTDYTIPGDLHVDQTLHLFALLQRLGKAEAKGSAGELKRILAQAEEALLPIFQVYQPDLEKMPFGAAGLGHVLRRVLTLIGLLQVAEPGEGDAVDPQQPPEPLPVRRRSTPKMTTPTSRKRISAKRASAGSAGSSS